MSRRHLSTSTVLHGVTIPFCVSIFYLLFVLISILVELAEIASDKLRTRQIPQRVFRVDFISALLGNYYKFFYAVKMCFKSNMLFIRLGYCL